MTAAPLDGGHRARDRDDPGGAEVLLLRHGWAIERELWTGDDRDRPLDGRGRAQARALPAHLAAHDLEPVHLVSTPTERSRATLAPLAEAAQLEIHEDERFTDADPPLRSDDAWADSAWLATRALGGLDELRRGPAAQAAGRAGPNRRRPVLVVCAHGCVLPALLAALGARDGWRLERGPDLTGKAMAKGSGWLLPAVGDHVVTIDAPVIPETTDPGSAA